MWEKLEELRANELKDPSASKKDELLKRRKKPEGEVLATGEISADEAAQQAACFERFKLAGASEIDISTILKNHCSNEEATQQMVESLKTEGNDGPNDQNDLLLHCRRETSMGDEERNLRLNAFQVFERMNHCMHESSSSAHRILILEFLEEEHVSANRISVNQKIKFCKSNLSHNQSFDTMLN
ncbi:hypothetical protein RND71_019389 [Anisodus tanguticus]|uniref:Uncharacterized protein n=1 Tax=Anisodus tanguticus TaxID=243964 RepID=A0AAE1S0E6_9SOLA|nr:hypothetical protein RND71_019389 [Anisodus tanguticus]